MTTKTYFRAWAKEHPNFMTPTIIELNVKGNYVVEVSEGTGMEGQPIFGVTKLKKITGGGFETMGGKMFFNKTSARNHAKKLLRGI